MPGPSEEGPGIYWLLVETGESRTIPRTQADRVGSSV